MTFVIKQGDKEVARVIAPKIEFSKKNISIPGRAFETEPVNDPHLFKVTDEQGKSLVVVLLSNTRNLTIEQC